MARKKKQGAQPGNGNALTTGVKAGVALENLFDGRTRLGKKLNLQMDILQAEVGGMKNFSGEQLLLWPLIRQQAMKVLYFSDQIEIHGLLTDKGEVRVSNDAHDRATNMLLKLWAKFLKAAPDREEKDEFGGEI